MKLTRAFLTGFPESTEIVERDLYRMNLNPCRGCFCCWRQTPGICAIKDDMGDLLKEYLEADVVVWSFPLYYFLMPSQVKLFFDRLLPLSRGEIEKTGEDSSAHAQRYDLSRQEHVLICTCGFSTKKDNFEHLTDYFQFLFDDLTTILCPEGELFRVPGLKELTGAYLANVEQVGREYAETGGLSPNTQKRLGQLILPEDVFLEMANNSWGD